MMPFGGTRMPRVVIRCTMEHGSNNWIIQCANVQSRTIPYNQILIPYNQILLSLQGFVFYKTRADLPKRLFRPADLEATGQEESNPQASIH